MAGGKRGRFVSISLQKAHEMREQCVELGIWADPERIWPSGLTKVKVNVPAVYRYERGKTNWRASSEMVWTICNPSFRAMNVPEVLKVKTGSWKETAANVF